MNLTVFDSIEKINPVQWNQLVKDNHPFLQHAFLAELEKQNCLGKEFGWYPVFFCLFEQQALIAACPCYIKTNSYGEFVFDMAWADFYQNNNQQYYPKLVSAIPYSPVNGERFLHNNKLSLAEVSATFSQAIQDFCRQNQLSGAHILFNTFEEQKNLLQHGWIHRQSCQYHWFNRNYQNFDHFLQDFTAKKRKNVRQERKRIQTQGLVLQQKSGDQLTPQEIEQIHYYYKSTFDKKWGYATLTAEFFAAIAQQLAKQMMVVFAYHQQKTVACSIFFASDTTLYGRYWGCDGYFEQLHFEACYYQGIEYCINHKLSFFEPGAQGEHKIPRGFIPTTTWSSHWLSDSRFFDIIKRHVEHENSLMNEHCEELKKRLPFKQDYFT